MPSLVDICNNALGYIGNSAQIEDFDTDDSTAGELVRLHYPQALDALLRRAIWPFAQRSVALAVVEADPTPLWAYSYRTPADCLRPVSIPLSATTGAPFAVASDVTGGLIYTSISPATLFYTALIEDVNLFPQDFADALAWALAVRIAYPLSKSFDVVGEARKGAALALATALTAAGNAQQQPEPPPCEFLAVRGVTAETFPRVL